MTRRDGFQTLCEAYGLPKPKSEYRFHPTRRWRFDYIFDEYNVAVEIDGAVWVRGRHTRGKGFISDCDKCNEAQLYGWIILRFTTTCLEKDTDRVINQLKRALEARRGERKPVE